MGSEMCIRDRENIAPVDLAQSAIGPGIAIFSSYLRVVEANGDACLLYTSDAADERSSVDLGGCRIIKKKT